MQGHSHFAFIGWITMTLISLLVNYLEQHEVRTNYQKYHLILKAHLYVSYAMLISFILEGYGLYSIILSTATIFLSYIFMYHYLRDLRKVSSTLFSKKWLKAALMLWAFSSLGAFSLAYLMASHVNNQDLYVLAIYLFLHFQYNGWFLFAAMGLFYCFVEIKMNRQAPASKTQHLWGVLLFKWLSLLVVPSYFLSTLWLRMPSPIIWIAYLAAAGQIMIIICLVQWLSALPTAVWSSLSPQNRLLWRLCAIAFTLKICLQALSAIPALSQYAFGFRPIVIGYLHLAFIGIISFFIMGAILNLRLPIIRRYSKPGLMLFITGFVLQELILMIQGLEALKATSLTSAGMLLLYCAILMALGLMLITLKIIHNRTSKRGSS